MTEPVSLANIRVHLRLGADFISEDDYLCALITAARAACEGRINRAIIGKAASRTFDAFPAYDITSTRTPNPRDLELALPGGTVASIDTIDWRHASGDWIAVEPDEYIADLTRAPARVGPVTSWPVAGPGPGAVIITYTLSPLAPDELAIVGHAIRLLVGNWYSNRESAVIDTRGTPTELPLSVTWLLDPLRQIPGSVIRAGTHRDRVDIQAVTETGDGAGGRAKSWSTIGGGGDIACSVEPIAGGEAFAQGLTRNSQMYRVELRFRTDITPRNRLLWNGQALNIRTCGDPDRGRRERLWITAESGAGEP